MSEILYNQAAFLSSLDLSGYETLALQALDNPETNAFIDDFLWNYMGDSQSPHALPTLWRDRPDGRSYHYDESIAKGFTDSGHLVHVRRSHIASAELHLPEQYTHFVVTADIENKIVTEWRINDVRDWCEGVELTRELVLTTDVFDSHDGDGQLEQTIDPSLSLVRAELARRAFVAERFARDQAQARVTLESQQILFAAKNGQAEPLHDIGRFVRDRQKLQNIGGTALRQSRLVSRPRLGSVA